MSKLKKLYILPQLSWIFSFQQLFWCSGIENIWRGQILLIGSGRVLIQTVIYPIFSSAMKQYFPSSKVRRFRLDFDPPLIIFLFSEVFSHGNPRKYSSSFFQPTKLFSSFSAPAHLWKPSALTTVLSLKYSSEIFYIELKWWDVSSVNYLNNNQSAIVYYNFVDH